MMSTVKFKTTTNNNDNFQRAVAGMLKNMCSSTNDSLDVTQTSDNKIIIQPMNNLGGWGFNIDVVNKKPKEKKVYHLHDDYNDTEEFVKLSEDFVEFLEWLKDHDFMTCEFEYEDVTDMDMAEF